MSPPDTPFNDIAIDPFLPAMSQGDFSHEYLRTESNPSVQDHAFSPAGSNIFDSNEFLDSATSSGVSTPDFTGYNFGQKANDPYALFAYPPNPGPTSPHPYPIQQQQQQQHHGFHPDVQFAHRPTFVRSVTNTPTSSYLHPPLQQHSRVQQPYHRRSLSQSDADRINASLNPAFVRHLAPRSRPLPQQHHAKKSKFGPSHQKTSSRSTSVEAGNRGQSKGLTSEGSTSIPIETSIGTPFYMTLTGNNDIRLKHMSYEEQRKESPRILEIGAMAVINTPRSTPMHSRCASQSCNDKESTLMERLDGLERQMGREMGECEKGKTGCEMIREALAEKQEQDALREFKELTDGEAKTISNSAEEGASGVAPKQVLPGTNTNNEQAIDAEEDVLFELLMNDTNTTGFKMEQT